MLKYDRIFLKIQKLQQELELKTNKPCIKKKLNNFLKELSTDSINQKEKFKIYKKETGAEAPFLFYEEKEKYKSFIENLVYENKLNKFKDNQNQLNLLKFSIWVIKKDFFNICL